MLDEAVGAAVIGGHEQRGARAPRREPLQLLIEFGDPGVGSAAFK